MERNFAKRAISLFLALTMLFQLSMLSVFADEDSIQDDIVISEELQDDAPDVVNEDAIIEDDDKEQAIPDNTLLPESDSLPEDSPMPVGAPNPYLPLWEHVPDGEPRLFQDPDDPTGTKKRVYIFGSHDVKRDNYCSADIVAWSAPINDLSNWRYEGAIFTSYNESTNTWDRMFAPDIAEKRVYDPTNPKAKGDGFVYTYYLYPHNISDDVLSFNGFRMNMVAVSDRPDGPFKVINWVDENDRTLDTLGPIGFDPGVFIDYSEDGKEILGAYVFWGFQQSIAGELDVNTMYTLKPHTESAHNSQMYTTESFAALTAAIENAQAVYDDEDATQADVDNAIRGVLEKLPQLEKMYEPAQDVTPLKALIAIGKALISKYPGRFTDQTVENLRAAISAGETRINYSNRNSTQAQINTARDNLLTAIYALEQAAGYDQPVKKYALYVVIKRAQSIYNDRPVYYMIPSSASSDNDQTYPYVHQRAKEGRTLAQMRSAFGFFEASSIRKVGNKYVMVYSGSSGSEYGMGNSSSTLRYAFADTPMGPWVDGGVLVDSRGPEVNKAGTGIGATNYASNTHGSILEIPAANPDGTINPEGESQWYVFYHRPPRGNGNARQAAVAPIKVEWDEESVDEGGSVRIRGFDPYAEDKIWEAKDSSGRVYTGAEVTSEGFNPYGLPPYRYYSAGIACYFVNDNPGSVINVLQDVYDVWNNNQPVTGMQNNYVIGFKYFDFEHYTAPENNTIFDVYLTPVTNQAFKIEIMLDTPWEGVRGGEKIGEIVVLENSPQVKTKFSVPVPKVDTLGKKHAIYLRVVGGSGSLCDIWGISFSKQGAPTESPAEAPIISIKVNGNEIKFPDWPTNYTVYNGIYDYEVYEAYYPVSLDQETVPVVTAICSDKDVKISISQAESTPGVAIVRFNKDGRFKTYIITFSPGAVITPQKEGKPYGDAAKAASDVVELGRLKDLVAADKWNGDWEMWINVATDPKLNTASFGSGTQAGLIITDGTDYIRLNTRRQSATQVGAGAGWKIDGTTANGTNRNFNAAHSQYYLKIVKKGNTLQAFSFTNSSTATNWDNLGAAQTFTPEFFENAKVEAYATNDTTYDLSATIAIVPEIMGVRSTIYNTYELYTADQIAVDAAGIVVGDGIAITGNHPGETIAEKAQNAVLAKLVAAGTITVKKATHSQVKEMRYDADLSNFVFDTCTVTTDPGKENTGPYKLTIKAGNTSMEIEPYYVDISGLVQEPLVNLSADDIVQPGSTFTVAVSLDNLEQGVFAEDITLSYDPNVFEYVSTQGANENIHIVREAAGNGTIRIIAANIGGVTGESTPVLNVLFKVMSGVQGASEEIAVTDAKLGVAPEGTVITPHLTSKTIRVASEGPTVDKRALGALISAVHAIYDAAVEGMENGQYPAAAKAALLAAINAAKAVYDDNDATQSEVDNARNALQEAKEIFEASIITESTGDLNKDGAIDIGDLAIAAFYYGKTSESEDWEDAKAADVNCDGIIGIEDLAFIAMRIIG